MEPEFHTQKAFQPCAPVIIRCVPFQLHFPRCKQLQGRTFQEASVLPVCYWDRAGILSSSVPSGTGAAGLMMKAIEVTSTVEPLLNLAIRLVIKWS